MNGLPPRVRRLFRLPWRSGDRIRDDIDEEIAFHLDMRTEELVNRHGMDPEEARERAEREFGDVDGAKRTLRGEDETIERRARWRVWFDGVRQDLAFALRALRKRPGFAAVAVLTLALGIAATTLVFTVVNGVLLRPLPYAESDRIVNLWQTNEAWLEEESPVLRAFATRFPASYPVYEDWRSMTRAFSAVGAYEADEEMTVTGGDRAERVPVVRATADVFDVLGVEPAFGRTYTAREDRVGGPALAVLSHGYWQRWFGGDSTVVGRTLVLDGRAHTILGVMPAGFYFPAPEHELWVTFDDGARGLDRGSQFLHAVARLGPGVDLDAAGQDLAAVTRRIREANPGTQGSFGARLVPRLDEVVAGGTRRSLLLLFASAALVLLVACANVVNMLLVRATTRGREIAVRAALGAGRGRLARALLSESLVLGAVGGALGVLSAVVLVDPLVGLLPDSVPRVGEIGVDGRVLGFALAATLGAALLGGLAPAVVAARTRVGVVLRDAARGLAGARRAGRARSALVVAELALAFLLLVSAGLLGRSLVRLAAVDPGIDAAGLVVTELTPPEQGYPDAAAMGAVLERIRGRVGALPGVETVAYAENIPFFGGSSSGSVELEDLPGQSPNVGQAVVSDGYFEALGIRVLRGRGFRGADRGGAPAVAVVSRSMAERFWPNGNAIGRRVRDAEESEWRTIVGVADDVRHGGLAEEPTPRLYVPIAQRPEIDDRTAVLTVRAERDADDVVPALRAAIGDVAPDVPVPTVARMSALVDRSVADPRFRALLTGALALLAAVLAVAGVYALLAFSVVRREAEIGVRIALGASPGRVVRQVLARGVGLAALGLALGLPAALAATRLLRDFLFEVSPTDPAVFAGAVLLIVATAAVAAYLPARRAVRVDPVAALRAE